MNSGTSAERHPWFGRPEKALVKHRQVSKNYGRAGGWLDCTFWIHPNGDPTGITVTTHLKYEPIHTNVAPNYG